MDSVAGIAVTDLGLTGLLSLAVLLILGGGLVPRWLYRSALAEKNLQIDEKNKRIEKLEDLTVEQSQQISTLIPKIELSVHIADALKKLGAGEGP